MIIENSQLAKNSFEKLKADLRIISNSLEHSASSGEYILRKKSNSQFLNCQNESFYREFLIRWKNHEYRKNVENSLKSKCLNNTSIKKRTTEL